MLKELEDRTMSFGNAWYALESLKVKKETRDDKMSPSSFSQAQ